MAIRDDFPETVKRALRERVGGHCSRPECRRPTVSPNQQELGRVDITGRAAHITAAQSGGPRYDPSLTAADRKAPNNGIWLCADCADLIDKNAGAGFTAAQLRSWKQRAEDRQKNAATLTNRARRPEWLDNISTPHYVNIPRLIHMLGHNTFSASTLNALQNGFPSDRAIIRELVEVENALRGMTVNAVDVFQINDPSTQLAEGLTISYFQACRTKNGAATDPEHIRNYSFNHSPLIYFDRVYRYIQPYDPRWLTTRTAEGTVRSGSTRMAGIAIIKAVDHLNKTVLATPITFGIPSMFI